MIIIKKKYKGNPTIKKTIIRYITPYVPINILLYPVALDVIFISRYLSRLVEDFPEQSPT